MLNVKSCLLTQFANDMYYSHVLVLSITCLIDIQNAVTSYKSFLMFVSSGLIKHLIRQDRKTY